MPNAHNRSPSTYSGVGLVAFVDILGFSEAALRDWHNVLPRLLRIKNAAGVATPSVTFVNENAKTPFLPEVKAVSDSIILSLALPIDSPPLSRLTAFAAITTNIGFALSACIREGFAWRGAIEIGEIYRDASDIVGPALVRAYHLESSVARSTRIVIGPALLKMLSRLEGTIPYEPLSPMMKCEDGLVALSPERLLDDKAAAIQRLKEMRAACDGQPSRQEKYDGVIALLEDHSCITRPTYSDLLEAAQATEDRLSMKISIATSTTSNGSK